jgi:tetratricopeptide (TPR) repeat protein
LVIHQRERTVRGMGDLDVVSQGAAEAAHGALAAGGARRAEAECAELIRLRRYPEAIAALKSLLNRAAGNAWAHAHLGDVSCTVLGDYEAALEHFDRAISLQPRYAWAIAHRGATLERLDRFAEAEADLRLAIELNPRNAWARAMLCRVHQFCGRADAALAELQALIQLDSSVLPDWRAERGLLQTLAGRHELAHELYLQALEHDPRDRLALYNVAINLQLWQGSLTAAPWIARARALLHGSPPSSRVTFELGGLLALEGHAESALDALHGAIQQERGLVLLSPSAKRARVDVAWRQLRRTPRFLALTAQHQTANRKELV